MGGRVLVIAGGRGGCGRTSVAANLASALTAHGQVCLVDLDLAAGDIATMFGVEPAADWPELEPLGDRLDSVLAPGAPGAAARIPAISIAELITALRARYDWVVADTPQAFGERVLAALDLADLRLIVTTPDVPAQRDLRLTLDMLDLLGYPGDTRAIVVNRFTPGLAVPDVHERAEIAALLPSTSDVPLSVNLGHPLTAAKPDHAFSREVRGLADRITASRSPPSTG